MQIRGMTNGDIALGMELKGQAGWNQTVADWRRFLHLDPEGCFVAESDGRSVGTTTTCVFDAVGWIAMVLVDTAHRHRGIGTQLVEHAISHLEQRGVSAIRLDATPLGRPIYERLGFVAQFDLFRWKGTARSEPLSGVVKQLTPDRFDALCGLDRRVTHVGRRRLLTPLFHEQPEMTAVAEQDERVVGYTMIRPGSRATQIGPAASLTPEAGRALADWAFGQCGGDEVFIDIPEDNGPATAWASSKGLAQQRVLTRMCRGQDVCDCVSELWASSGPEKG